MVELPLPPEWEDWPFAERRVSPDRRRWPTRFASLFRLAGLRERIRRRGESGPRYFDRLSTRTVALTLSVVVLSILDALFTLLHLQDGRREMNPLMELALLMGVPVFLAVKTGLTNVGVIVIAAHQSFRLGRVALNAAAAAYTALLAYHLLLFLRAAV